MKGTPLAPTAEKETTPSASHLTEMSLASGRDTVRYTLSDRCAHRTSGCRLQSSQIKNTQNLRERERVKLVYTEIIMMTEITSCSWSEKLIYCLPRLNEELSSTAETASRKKKVIDESMGFFLIEDQSIPNFGVLFTIIVNRHYLVLPSFRLK